MKKKIVLLLLLFVYLLGNEGHATNYYVSNSGNDSNPGTIAQPFETIQKAVDTMQPGDIAYVNPGIYRETITSVRSGTSGSPITIKTTGSGDVIVTATDDVPTWTVHSGDTYKATLNKQVYQLFVFGSSFYDFSSAPTISPAELMVEARYPNLGSTSKGIFETPEDGNFTSMTKSGSNVTVSGLPGGSYTGAKLYAYAASSGDRWWSHTADITGNSGNVLTGSTVTMEPWLSSNVTGYVAGPLQLLDAQKEWSSDGTNLYFKAQASQNPNSLNVEAKTRGLTFKIDHDYINIEGIKTFGGAIWVSGNQNKLKSLDMRYPNNQMTWGWSYLNPSVPAANPSSGLRMLGDNNEFINSKMHYCGGEGITLNGDFNTIENNDISYTSYYGHFMHSIQLIGDDNTIIGNSIFHGGKSHVRVHHGGGDPAERSRILYNNISANGYVAHDIGMVVLWGAYTTGTEIAYNWIHDNLSTSIAGGNHGIYLDNNNKDVLIHHNVIWNIKGSNIRFNSPQYNIYVYNNTLGRSDENIGHGIYYNNTLGVPDEMSNVNLKNNYMHRAITFPGQYSVNLSNNVQNTTITAFDWPNFFITSSSPAVDQGTTLSTVEFSGATYLSVNQFVTDGSPDAGAYEAGGVQWLPGVNRIENSGDGNPINIALGKSVSQSSTDWGGLASRAADGDTNGDYNGGNSVTHTNSEANAWWEIDLGAIQNITDIKVFNRTDCCASRLSNYHVFVSDVAFTSTDLTTTINQAGVGNFYQSGQAGTPTTIAADRTGRYVRVQLAGTNALSLAELQVLVTDNVANGKSVSQSSTAAGGVASRAVDGNTNGDYSGGNSVTHTNSEANAWWEVDLGSVYDIDDVKVYNRTDCCSDRLTNYHVFVSDVAFTSTDLTTTINQTGVGNFYQSGEAGTPTKIATNRTGRYVRVQLAGTNALSLAELQVIVSDASSARFGNKTPITSKIDEMSKEVVLYPNPASSRLQLDYFVDSDLPGYFQLINIHGQQILERKLGLKKGNNTLNFNISTIPQGIYFFKGKIGTNSISKKVLIGQ